MTDDIEEVSDIFHESLSEFLLELSQDDTLPDDVRNEAYYWWRSEEDEPADPEASAEEGQEAG